MMHVLAPCLNSLSEPTFFSDIYFLVGLNEDAALEVVRELARRSIRQPELLHNLRFDSQLSGRTDVMVGLVSNKLLISAVATAPNHVTCLGLRVCNYYKLLFH